MTCGSHGGFTRREGFGICSPLLFLPRRGWQSFSSLEGRKSPQFPGNIPKDSSQTLSCLYRGGNPPSSLGTSQRIHPKLTFLLVGTNSQETGKDSSPQAREELWDESLGIFPGNWGDFPPPSRGGGLGRVPGASRKLPNKILAGMFPPSSGRCGTAGAPSWFLWDWRDFGCRPSPRSLPGFGIGSSRSWILGSKGGIRWDPWVRYWDERDGI